MQRCALVILIAALMLSGLPQRGVGALPPTVKLGAVVPLTGRFAGCGWVIGRFRSS